MVVDERSGAVGKDIIQKIVLDIFAPERFRINTFNRLRLSSDILCCAKEQRNVGESVVDEEKEINTVGVD